jgi:hypothetical protein
MNPDTIWAVFRVSEGGGRSFSLPVRVPAGSTLPDHKFLPATTVISSEADMAYMAWLENPNWPGAERDIKFRSSMLNCPYCLRGPSTVTAKPPQVR